MRYLDKYAAREKHLRRLEREVNRLYQANRAAPAVPLEQPYQRGWSKTYVLRDDVLRRPDAEVFRTVLNVVNNRVHAKTRDFIAADGEPIVLRPRMIREAAWQKLNWSARHRCLFSYGHWRCDEEQWRALRDRRLILGFKLTSIWWLREDMQPLMITHQKVDLPEVRARLAEIEAFMSATVGWPRLLRLHGKSRRWWSRSSPPSRQRADWDFRQQLGDSKLTHSHLTE